MLKSHFSRKFTCTLIIDDDQTRMSRYNDLKNLYFAERTARYVCDTCNKGYESRSGLYMHKQTCDSNLTSNILKEMRFSLTRIDQQSSAMISIMNGMTELMKAMHQTMINNGKLVYAATQISNSSLKENDLESDSDSESDSEVENEIAKPTPEIVKPKNIVSMGAEDVSEIVRDKNMMRQIVSMEELGLTKLIDLVWYNSKYPSHRNFVVKTTNMVCCFVKNRWCEMKMDEFLDELTGFMFFLFEQCVCKDDEEFKSSILNGREFLQFKKNIGMPLEWDLYHTECEDEIEMSENVLNKKKKQIYNVLRQHLHNKIP
jgi:hypothetical protein